MNWRLQHQADIERRRVPICVMRGVEEERSAAVAEDEIVRVAHRRPSMRRVRRKREDAIVQRIVEIKLRRELLAPSGCCPCSNLEVHMHGAAAIPSWVNSQELRASGCVRALVSAQE